MVFCKYTEVLFIFVIFRYHIIAVPFWLNPVKKCEDKEYFFFCFYIVILMIFIMQILKVIHPKMNLLTLMTSKM